MEDLFLEEMFQNLATFLIVFLVIIVVVYIAVGVFLNKFNKLVYGKGTPMAFIPLANIYLLGKLTVGKAVGIILVFLPIFTGSFTTNINGIENTYTILPANISSKISMIANIVTFGLFIYAIFLYFKIKKEKVNGTYVEEQKTRPLEGLDKTDVISNVINSSKDSVNFNTNSSSVNSKIEVNNTAIPNVDSVTDVESVTNISTINNDSLGSNIVNNNEPSELMKQYQNDNTNK